MKEMVVEGHAPVQYSYRYFEPTSFLGLEQAHDSGSAFLMEITCAHTERQAGREQERDRGEGGSLLGM